MRAKFQPSSFNGVEEEVTDGRTDKGSHVILQTSAPHHKIGMYVDYP